MSLSNILLPDIHRDPNIEFPKQFVADFIIETLNKHQLLYGDQKIITDWSTNVSLTSSQLIRDVNKIASEFKQRGFKPGQVISCLIDSDVNYFSFLLATWMTGCVLSSLQHAFPQDFLVHLLRKSQSPLLLCDQKSAARCLAAKKECANLIEIFVLGEFEGCFPFSQLLEKDALSYHELARQTPYDSEETVSMVFSSGTTGNPKGVLLTQSNIYSYLLTARPKVKLGMKTFFVPRISNVMGLLFGLRNLIIYSRTYLMSIYKDEYLFNAIHQIKPERLLLYLPHILALTNKLSSGHDVDLSSVQAVFTAGMPISKNLQEKLFAKLPSLKMFFTFYGMTEMAVAVGRPWADYEDNINSEDTMRKNHRLKPDSVGRLCPMNQMKVWDEATGECLGSNQKGELCFKGPSAFKSYWNDSEATAGISRDGWIHTGDIGYYDTDGDIFYVQRSKELIKFLGHHVVPSQLEAILKSHPEVEDAAVVGVVSEEFGELPRAYATKRSDCSHLDAESVIRFFHERIHDEASKLRGGLTFIPKIPRNGLGKIIRNRLRELAEKEWKLSS